MKSAWLAEFHRQWQRARGGRAEAGFTAFSRDWQKLLADAGITAAEDIKHAEREADSLAASGRLTISHYRHRLIQRVRLPRDHEAWLRGLFQSDAPAELRERALEAVKEAQVPGHPLYPDLWSRWCISLENDFAAGRNQRPLLWRRPDNVRALLALVRELTAREWPPHTLVRDADVALGLLTKTIERQRRTVEAALTQLFHRETTLEALNIQSANSRLLFDGPLTLEFADGTRHEAGRLRHGDFVTAADLARAVRVSTTASRLLSVENSKTTFRHLAAQNDTRDALLVATSFPTRAVQLLLEKLPSNLPHFHFGDTDPAGYFILLKLRQLTPRPVHAWQMEWRDRADSPRLNGYDARTIPALLSAGELADSHASIGAMKRAGRKGDYEQENRFSQLPP